MLSFPEVTRSRKRTASRALMATWLPARFSAWRRSRAKQEKKKNPGSAHRSRRVFPHLSQRDFQHTVQRNYQGDRTIRSPFLDFTDIGSQGGFVHSTVEDLTSGRHDGWQKESFVLVWIVAGWKRRPGKNKVEIIRQPLHQAAQSEGCDCERRQHWAVGCWEPTKEVWRRRVERSGRCGGSRRALIKEREEVTLTTRYRRQQYKERHSSATFCDLWMMGNRSLKRDEVLGVTAMPSR